MFKAFLDLLRHSFLFPLGSLTDIHVCIYAHIESREILMLHISEYKKWQIRDIAVIFFLNHSLPFQKKQCKFPFNFSNKYCL